MKNLIIVAHNNIETSVYNKQLIESIKNNNNTTINILKTNMALDVNAERELFLKHQNIIFQFPLNWYSVPASLKNYIDLVFGFGFGFAPTDERIMGKNFLAVVTTGGPQVSYSAEGYNKFSVEDYLHPLKGLARLTKMNFLPPLVSYASKKDGSEPEFATFKEKYKKTLETL